MMHLSIFYKICLAFSRKFSVSVALQLVWCGTTLRYNKIDCKIQIYTNLTPVSKFHNVFCHINLTEHFQVKKKQSHKTIWINRLRKRKQNKEPKIYGCINWIIILSILFNSFFYNGLSNLDSCKIHYGNNSTNITETKESFQLVSYAISQQFFYKVLTAQGLLEQKSLQLVLKWVNCRFSGDSVNITLFVNHNKRRKTHLDKVSIRIHTDIGFSWLSVYTENAVTISTKVQLRYTGHFQP